MADELTDQEIEGDDIDPVGARVIPDLLVVLVVGLVGAAMGPLLLVKVYHVFDHAKITARLWEWVFILGVETSFWALAFVPLWSSVRRLWRFTATTNAERLKLFAFVVLLGVLAGIPLFTAHRLGFFSPLDRQFKPLELLVAIGCIVAAPGVIGIWLVDRCVAQRLSPDRGVAQIVTYLRLKRYLDVYRSFLGIMLGLVVLAAGAQRAAIVAATHGTGFRPVFVLLFGGYNTLLLAVVYVPAYLRLVATGREIVDGIEPIPKKEKDMAVALAQRQTLVNLFGLETSATDKLKSALFLLAPVFSSIVVTITGAGAT